MNLSQILGGEQPERVLASAIRAMAPAPFDLPELSSATATLLAQVRRDLSLSDQGKLEPSEAARVIGELISIVHRDLVPPINLDNARARLGERGHLPIDQYSLVLSPTFEMFDAKLGWTLDSARELLATPDAVQNISPSDPSDSIFCMATRRLPEHLRTGGLALVIATGKGERLTINNVLTLFDDQITGPEWREPLAALQRFVEIFGLPFSVGSSAPKKFFFDETHPLVGLQAGTPLFNIANANPRRRFFSFVRARQSHLGFAVVKIGFVVDYETYETDLRRRSFRAPRSWLTSR